MANSLQNQPAKNPFADVEPAIFPDNPRKEGEYDVRVDSDVFAKPLLEARKREIEEARGNKLTGGVLRESYMPEGMPGHVPEKLMNLYPMERYLDAYCKLAHDASQVNRDPILAVVLSTVGQVTGSIGKTFSGKDKLAVFKLPFSIVTAALDVVAQGRDQELRLKQELVKKGVEYASYNQGIMLAERRDHYLWRLADAFRGYLSHNRQEWFGMGAALAGLHQMVGFAIYEMVRASIHAEKSIEGSTHREALNILFRPVSANSFFKK